MSIGFWGVDNTLLIVIYYATQAVCAKCNCSYSVDDSRENYEEIYTQKAWLIG